MIFTEEIKNVTPQGAEFVGNIKSLGSGKGVIRYGFVWGKIEQPTLNSSNSAVSSDVKTGKFSLVINSDLAIGKEYYVRSFIETSTVTVYGNELKFTSKGSMPPVITSFSPLKGFDGAEVTIRGKNFSQSKTGNVIKIGDLPCTVISASDSVIKCEVPLSQNIGDYKVQLEVAGHTVTHKDNFSILGARIKSISKCSGRVGDLLTIDGEYFDVAKKLIVFFGDYALSSNYSSYSEARVKSAEQLECRIPDMVRTVPQLILYSQLANTYKDFVHTADFTIIDSWSKVGGEAPFYRYAGYSNAMINNKIYVIGGETFYEYDALTKQWTSKAHFPGPHRFYGTAFVFNNKLYYGFGERYQASTTDYSHNVEYYNDLWEYDPALDTWRSIGELPLLPRGRMLSMVIQDKIYLGFGVVNWPTSKSFTDFWEYDLSSNTCKSIANPIQSYSGRATAFVVGNKGYMVGLKRTTTTKGTSDFLEFDPTTLSWIEKEDFPDKINGEAATVRGENGIVALSSGNTGYNRVYEYDTKLEKWIKRQSLFEYQSSGGYVPGKFLFAQCYNNKLLYYTSYHLWEMSFD